MKYAVVETYEGRLLDACRRCSANRLVKCMSVGPRGGIGLLEVLDYCGIARHVTCGWKAELGLHTEPSDTNLSNAFTKSLEERRMK